MLIFLAGLFVGTALGVVIMCLCVAAGDADRAEERNLSGGRTESKN